jgi:hypothetical protein
LLRFATDQRTNEIGVRTAVGGRVLDIAGLFTREVAKIVTLGNSIAWPIARSAMPDATFPRDMSRRLHDGTLQPSEARDVLSIVDFRVSRFAASTALSVRSRVSTR